MKHGYPSQEYIERMERAVEEAREEAIRDPETAKIKARESLERMGLMADGKMKDQIITRY